MRRLPVIIGCAFLSFTGFAGAQDEVSPTEFARVKARLSALQIDKYVTLKVLQKRTDASGEKVVQFSYEVPFAPGMQDQMEKNYEKINGQSFWTKLVMIIADVTGAKVASISGTGPGTMYCRSSSVRLRYGQILRGEGGCMAAVTYLNLTFPDSERRLAGDGLATRTSALSINDLETTLVERFKKFGGTSEVRERSDFHRVFSIWGMKNVVLKGENVWEKVNILATVSERKDQNQRTTYQILFSSDGYIASGIGAAPPITSYDTSMEPKYFKYLDDFNRSLALNFSRN